MTAGRGGAPGGKTGPSLAPGIATTPFRWRGVVCGLAIVAGLALYAVLVATASLWVPRHWAAELAFHLVAGLSWLWPAACLVAWAGRDGAAPTAGRRRGA